jgi:hypothetical protein
MHNKRLIFMDEKVKVLLSAGRKQYTTVMTVMQIIFKSASSAQSAVTFSNR